MSEIRCPSCGKTGRIRQSLEEVVLEWPCPWCKRTFEVRIVFFERPRVVDKDAFADEVRAEMERQGLNQAELARLLGVTGAYISTLLSGKREISPEVADRVTNALGEGVVPPLCNDLHHAE